MNTNKLFKRKLSNEVMRDFFSSLYMFVSSGISINEALNLIEIKRNHAGYEYFNLVKKGMDNGKSLADSFDNLGVVDSFVLSILSVAEKSDKIIDSIKRIEEYYGNKILIKDDLYKIFAYPVILFVSILIFGLGITSYIVPKVINEFYADNAEIPDNLKSFMAVNEHMDVYGMYVFFGAFLILLLYTIIWENGMWKYHVEKYIISKTALARMIQIYYIKNISWKLYILLESSVGMNKSLEIIGEIENNAYYKLEILKLNDEIKSGGDVIAAFENCPIFDKTSIVYIRKGYSTDSLNKSFKEIAIIYEKNIDEYMRRIKIAAQPIMICVLGIMVGALAVFVLSITDVSNYYGEGIY